MQRFGKYTLIEKITTGGMAEVWRGVATGPGGFQRQVAIKKILPCYAESKDFDRMFRDEAILSGRVTHANIAQVFDHDVIDGVPYIAMEYVEGKDLRAMLARCAETGTTPPFGVAVFVALEVAKGLYTVHSRREASRPLNIVHRDVSPQNIMVSHAGEVKLVDFGIARWTPRREAHTQAGTVKGKYAYMSPEQVLGKPLDHRTDIFSLGVVLWEMLTVKRLFAGSNEGETISNVLKTRVQLPHLVNPTVPTRLSPLVMKALSREREGRYPTMLALYDELSKFLFDTGSYPDMESVGRFVCDLFPDEMERLIQGEHLAVELPPEDTGEAEILASDTDPAAGAHRETAAASPEAHANTPPPPLPLHALEEETATVPSATPVARRAALVSPRVAAKVLGGLVSLVLVAGLAFVGAQNLGWLMGEKADQHPSKTSQQTAGAGVTTANEPMQAQGPVQPVAVKEVPTAPPAREEGTEDQTDLGLCMFDGLCEHSHAARAEPAETPTPVPAPLDPKGIPPPEAAPPALAASGAGKVAAVLDVAVDPEGAVVEINGRAQAPHPHGSYGYSGRLGETVRVRVSRDGYAAFEDDVVLKKAYHPYKKVNKLNVRLKSVAVTSRKALSGDREDQGTVEVQATPYAEVWEDGKMIYPQVPVVTQLKVGKYQWELRYLDQTHLCNLTVELGKKSKCFYQFLPLEEDVTAIGAAEAGKEAGKSDATRTEKKKKLKKRHKKETAE